MAFEKFVSTRHPYHNDPPAVRVNRGVITLNAAAFKLLNNPQQVEFYYDTKTRQIGLRAVEKGYKIGQKYTHKTYINSLVEKYQIPQPFSASATLEGDMLVFTVPSDGE